MKPLFYRNTLLLLFITLFFLTPFSQSQVSAQVLPQESLLPEEYSPDEFPQWAWDLRRFEVISFGVIPIAFFATSLIYDFSLYAASGFQPSMGLGTQRSANDIAIIMGVSAGLSILIGATDFIITQIKRSRAEKELNQKLENRNQQN